MNKIEKAKSVLETLKKKLENNEYFNGIEVAAAGKTGKNRDDVCVRILVNSPNINHSKLGIPSEMEGVPIEIADRTIKPL